MNVEQLLNVLAAYTSHINPDLPLYLQQGFTPHQIYQRAPISFHLPHEVLALYQWHNGTREHPTRYEQELFYYHEFMSIEKAYEVYMWRMQFNEEEHFEVFDPQLFPIFTFQGEYYATQCSQEQYDHSAIFFDYHGCAQVYDNLYTMLLAIVECYESKAYYREKDEYKPIRAKVAEIKAKWNTCRYNTDGSILNDHP